MAKKPQPTVGEPKDQVIWCRMPAALVRRLDRRVEREQRAAPHANVSRSSVIRSLVSDAIDREKSKGGDA